MPISYPALSTLRFQFRPFALADIEALAALADERRTADTTVGVPQPYTADYARMWISSHLAAWEERRALHWAAVKSGEDRIAGYAGLDRIDAVRSQAELRLWVGRGAEKADDAVEWSAAIVGFGLRDLNLNRVYALQLTRFPIAGRVLAAVGMQQEGLLRKRIFKGGMVEDVVCWATWRSERQRQVDS